MKESIRSPSQRRTSEGQQAKLTAVLRAADDLAASCLRGALPRMQRHASDKTSRDKSTLLTSSGLASGLFGAGHESKCVDVVVVMAKGKERVGIVQVPLRVYIRPGRARDVAP